MSKPVAPDDHPEPRQAQPPLEILHAQYRLAVARARSADSAERARALAEARRLIRTAVSLCANAAAERPQSDPTEPQGPVSGAPAGRSTVSTIL